MAEADQANWEVIQAAAAQPRDDASRQLQERSLLSAHSAEPGAGWAWALAALGSAGIVAVSVFYVLSPQAAVVPNLAADLEPARIAALTDTGFMRLAGATGVLSDLMAAAGALGLAQASSRKSARQAVGFYLLACSALVFIVVDALVGFSLRASAAAGLATFAVVKPLFDALTGAGSFACGVGCVLFAWPAVGGVAVGPRGLVIALTVGGALLALTGPASVWGLNVGLPMGFAITVQTALLTVFTARNALLHA